MENKRKIKRNAWLKLILLCALLVFVVWHFFIPAIKNALKIEQVTREKLTKILHQEIATLDSMLQVKLDAIPDSLKTVQHDASHNLMYVEEGSDSYWDAKGSIRRAQEEIDRLCPTCKPLREKIATKQKELEELF
jgi:hypothetical protein